MTNPVMKKVKPRGLVPDFTPKPAAPVSRFDQEFERLIGKQKALGYNLFCSVAGDYAAIAVQVGQKKALITITRNDEGGSFYKYKAGNLNIPEGLYVSFSDVRKPSFEPNSGISKAGQLGQMALHKFLHTAHEAIIHPKET